MRILLAAACLAMPLVALAGPAADAKPAKSECIKTFRVHNCERGLQKFFARMFRRSCHDHILMNLSDPSSGLQIAIISCASPG